MERPPYSPDGADGLTGETETTGRYLVLFEEDAVPAAVRALKESAGIVATTGESDAAVVSAEELEQSDAVVFDELGVAVVQADPEQIQALGARAADKSAIAAIEPERVVYALASWTAPTGSAAASNPVVSLSADYLRGYRNAVLHLTSPEALTEATVAPAPRALDESQATWGLQATNAVASRFTGAGVRIAVLDTGIDLTHPDFAARDVVTESFVAGEEVQDGHGHGTHCIGTAAGPLHPRTLPRYGVAFEAEIYAGKVLSNQGAGSDRGILAGIVWGMRSDCRIISMSLGAATRPGQSFSFIFEIVARRVTRAGTLIVAAAGNESRRESGIVSPVGHPANCPSIMAVGALDSQLRVAPFSNGGINPQGGQVDIAAPGVDVRSSWRMPTGYRTISGTSMATPHVAGLAALHAQANPDSTPREVWSLLTQTARRLPLPSLDVGAGLVQAP